MSLVRGSSTRSGRIGTRIEYAERRQTVRSTVLTPGTLACDHCDAPIAPGEVPLRLGDRLDCPFCGRHGPVRDFLSLSLPTRPAHVLVRVTLPRAAVERR